jgi:hypothetical protein
MKHLNALTHLLKGNATESEMLTLILDGTIFIIPIILIFANDVRW